MSEKIVVIHAKDAPVRAVKSLYPEPYASMMAGRAKQPLGDLFGLKNFGVNLLRLEPGAVSALHHRHFKQDEFIYVLAGEAVLISDEGEFALEPGMAAGFAAGGAAHHLHNRSHEDCLILEVGDRRPGDGVEYPNDDIKAVQGEDGKWQFTRKDGSSLS